MTARILRYEIRDELLGILREPTALFFSVLMPVGFFALFTAMFSGQATESPSTAMIVPFGTFGALAVVLMNPGIGLADARERGWLDRLRRDMSGVQRVEISGERATVETARGTRYPFRRRPNGIWGTTLFTAALTTEAERAARDLQLIERAADDYRRAASRAR